MSSKRKFRSLKQIYANTQPKITRFSEGGDHDRGGPSNAANRTVQVDMGLSGIGEKICRKFQGERFHTRAESGTCNVCGMLSTSCILVSQLPSQLGPKSGSDEACEGKKSSLCSFDDTDLFSSFKRSSCNDKQYTSSGTSNLISVCSSHVSFPEKAENQAPLNASDTLKDEMLVKISAAQTVGEDLGVPKLHVLHDGKVNSNQLEKQKDKECNGDDGAPSEISSLRDVYASAGSPMGEHTEYSTEKVESPLAKAENSGAGVYQHNADDCTESFKISTVAEDLGVPKSPLLHDRVNSNQLENQKDKECDADDGTPSEISSLRDAYASASSPKGEHTEYSTEKVESPLAKAENSGAGVYQHNADDCTESFKISTVGEDLGVPKSPLLHDRVNSNQLENQKDKECDADDGAPSEISSLRDAYASASSPKGEHTEYSTEKVESPLAKVENSGAGVYQHNADECTESVKISTVREDLGVPKSYVLHDGKVNSNQLKKQNDIECDVDDVIYPSDISSLRDVYASASSAKKEHSECSREQMESPLAKVENSGAGVYQQNAHDCTESVKTEKDMNNENLAVEAVNCLDQNEDFDRSSMFLKVANPQEQSLQVCAVSRTGESHTVKDDVKVCDICGDASQEELHATCCKCTDRAEHTYCMCIKLEKVPKGEWMCEECSVKDKAGKLKQDDFDKAEKSSKRSPLHECSATPQKSNIPYCKKSSKLNIKGITKKRGKKKIRSMFHFSSKRPMEKLDRVSMKKNSPLKTSVGSFRTSNHSGKVVLCQDSSIRDLNMGKIDSSRQKVFMGDQSSAHILEKTHLPSDSQLRLHKLKGSNRVKPIIEFQPICESSGHQNKLAGFDGVEMLPSHSSNVVKDLDITGMSGSTHDLNLNQVSTSTNIEVVPETIRAKKHECTHELLNLWRGGFEMKNSNRVPSFCDGVQAYSLACSSLRVNEVLKKFPQNFLLEEVLRSSTWPSYFQENYATEDNIALYFFAEDLESYRGAYKILLECMIKNDLALQGEVGGIEVLIFSSNLLPEKSQSWNGFPFLWGVFRGRRIRIEKINSVPDSNVVPRYHTMDYITASPMEQSMRICFSGVPRWSCSFVPTFFFNNQVWYANNNMEFEQTSRPVDTPLLSSNSTAAADESSRVSPLESQQVVKSNDDDKMESKIPDLENSLGHENDLEKQGIDETQLSLSLPSSSKK